MAEYAQMNPGKYHLGYRFPTPAMVDSQPMDADVDHRISLMYKHAVVLGRTVYVGNVRVTDEKGITSIQSDSMYKSGVNQFDTFADFRKIEAAVDDGESITALLTYGRKILQFKQDTLYILDVSGGHERLDSTHKHKGVLHPASVCRTDYGCAWANELGCFMYDGKQVTNLLEKGGRRVINEATWATFSVIPMIGYVRNKRQLIVVDDVTTNGDGSIYLYDMVTSSWTRGSAGTFADAAKTNLTHDANGNLIHYTGSTMLEWDDTADTSDNMVIQTRDFDFGHPGVRKKIYRVHITYDTGNAASNVQVKFAADGSTTFDKVFKDGTNFASNVLAAANGWQRAELKPNTSSEANNIYSFALKFSATGTGKEITRVKCVADVSDSLNGKYFDIYGGTGKTEVWIDTDNSGTSQPSGSGSYAANIEVTEIETNDTAEAVAIAVAEAVGDHADFSTEVDGDTVIITDAAAASRTDSSDGDTGFTITKDAEGGTSSVPAGFKINDISVVYRIKNIK